MGGGKYICQKINTPGKFLPVNREIPILPEHIQVGRVPPAFKKASVCELKDLGEYIKEGVEEDVEADQPHQMIWDRELK